MVLVFLNKILAKWLALLFWIGNQFDWNGVFSWLIPNKVISAMNTYAHYTLPTTHYTLQITNYKLNTTNYTLHTTHYTLHTTHYTLHTTDKGKGLRTKDWGSLVACPESSYQEHGHDRYESRAPQAGPSQLSGLVRIQIQAGPSQLLSAQILTNASFLLSSFLLNVWHIMALALILVKHNPNSSQFSFRQHMVLLFSWTRKVDNSTEHFLKQTDKNSFHICLHSVWNCMGSTELFVQKVSCKR